MSSHLCPLMMIAKPANSHTALEDYHCQEFDCKWWIRYKEGNDCTVNVLCRMLEGIGRLAAFGLQQRRVGIKT